MNKILFFVVFIVFAISMSYAAEYRTEVTGDARFLLFFDDKPEDYENLISSIGGELIYDYKNLKSIAIKIPKKSIHRLENLKYLKNMRI